MGDWRDRNQDDAFDGHPNGVHISVDSDLLHRDPADDDGPVDLALVHADDELLDLLGGAALDGSDRDDAPDDELSALLLSWRQDIDAEPIGDLVDARLATVTVHSARMRTRRRPRLLVPFAAAAAALAIVFAGFGLAARDAQPGDTLWALTKVLYAEHARSVEAAAEVRTDLRDAEAALAKGKVDEAKLRLEDAQSTLPTVSTEDGQADLEALHAELMAQLPGNPSEDVPSPPAPNPGTQPNPGTDSSSGSSEDSTSEQPSPSTPPSEDETTTPSDPSSTSGSKEEPPPGGGTGEGTEPNGGESPNGEEPAGAAPQAETPELIGAESTEAAEPVVAGS